MKQKNALWHELTNAAIEAGNDSFAGVLRRLCDRVETLESELKALRGDVLEPPPSDGPVWLIGQRVSVNGWPNGTIAGTDRAGDPLVVHDGQSIKRPHYAEQVTPL